MNLNLTSATRIGLNILALLGAAIALRLAESVFVPLVISALLASVLWPGAKYFHNRGVPWFFSCLLVVSFLVILNLAVFVGFAAAVPRLLEDLPRPDDYNSQLAFYHKIRGQVEKVIPWQISSPPTRPEITPEQKTEPKAETPADKADPKGEPPKGDAKVEGKGDAKAEGKVEPPPKVEPKPPPPPGEDGVFLFIRSTVTGEGMKQALFAVTRYGVTWFWQAVLILFIILFLLLEGEVLARRVRDIFGTQSETRHQVTQALLEMGQSVRTYLVWRTIINFALAVFLGAIYHSLGLRQAWTWALLTAILSYVPYLGTIAAGVPPLLDAFLNVSPVAAFFILCLYIAVVTFEGYIIVPWVMGRSMDMNATTVILSCLFWDLVWGTPGLFLAMPLMAAIKAVCNHVETWKPWARLMSTADWRETEAEAEKKLVAEERVRQIAQQVGTNGLADEPTVVMEGLDDRPPPGKSPV